jgi:hypothetical protein
MLAFVMEISVFILNFRYSHSSTGLGMSRLQCTYLQFCHFGMGIKLGLPHDWKNMHCTVVPICTALLSYFNSIWISVFI